MNEYFTVRIPMIEMGERLESVPIMTFRDDYLFMETRWRTYLAHLPDDEAIRKFAGLFAVETGRELQPELVASALQDLWPAK